MTPLPNHIRRQLPPLYAQQDAVVRVHFFNPCGTGNWWITGALPQGRLRLRATEGDPCQQERPGGWGDLQDLRQRLRRRRSQLTERDNGPLSQVLQVTPTARTLLLTRITFGGTQPQTPLR